MKINELMYEKNPGEIKIYYRDWQKSAWFSPHFKSVNNIWHGIMNNGESNRFIDTLEHWKLWIDPELTVTKWLWIRSDGHVTTCVYAEDKAFSDWIKIPGTAVEVPTN